VRSLIAAAALLAAVSTASGANLVYERYTIEVEPGSVLRQELSCPTEQLISGGFGLEDIKGGPPNSLMLAASTFGSKGSWRVEFLNLHDAALTVEFGITVLCD
jgi:hypothetical protein